uniref:Uncharacterized protein n=1 Tax=Anguilla anguilla TaxID=7936 RepID=A0A0E9R5F8_ANGAN
MKAENRGRITGLNDAAELKVEICVGEHFWIFLLKPVGMY